MLDILALLLGGGAVAGQKVYKEAKYNSEVRQAGHRLLVGCEGNIVQTIKRKASFSNAQFYNGMPEFTQEERDYIEKSAYNGGFLNDNLVLEEFKRETGRDLLVEVQKKRIEDYRKGKLNR